MSLLAPAAAFTTPFVKPSPCPVLLTVRSYAFYTDSGQDVVACRQRRHYSGGSGCVQSFASCRTALQSRRMVVTVERPTGRLGCRGDVARFRSLHVSGSSKAVSRTASRRGFRSCVSARSENTGVVDRNRPLRVRTAARPERGCAAPPLHIPPGQLPPPCTADRPAIARQRRNPIPGGIGLLWLG